MAYPSFPTPARAITQVGPGKLFALWAWAHLISAWACILLGTGGTASGSSGVREEVGARYPLSVWGMNCPSSAKCHYGQGCHVASASTLLLPASHISDSDLPEMPCLRAFGPAG